MANYLKIMEKALKNGDLDKVFTCFEKRWPSEMFKAWLRWRIPIIVINEKWYMCGEAAKLIQKRKMDERQWRKFLYSLCVAPKSNAAFSLWGLKSKNKHEITVASKIKEAIVYKNMDVIINQLSKWVNRRRKLTLYEKAALELMKTRAQATDIIRNKFSFLMGMVLLGHKRLKPKDVETLVLRGLKEWTQQHGARKPSLVSI